MKKAYLSLVCEKWCVLVFLKVLQACSVQGVTILRILKSGNLLVGSGCGTFTLCSAANFQTLK